MKVASCVLLCAVWLSVDCFSVASSRDKRLFKSAVNRIGHGFGKRQDLNQPSFYPPTNSRTPLTTHRLAKLLQENEILAYAIVEKFIDINGDGLISTDELLYGRPHNS